MQTADIPNLKLAKVGKDREKKRGGAAWLSGSASRGGFSAALGGQGGGSGFLAFLENALGARFALLLPKLLVAMLISSLGAGALVVGKSVKSAAQKNIVALATPKPFLPKAAAGPKYNSSEQTGVADGRGSVGMISESYDGKTQAQRDADAAAAAKAQADAAAAAKAKADVDAKASVAPPEQANALAGAPNIDPNALAAAAGAGAGGKGGKGFGAFSTSLGGATSGAGLSGNFGFAKPMASGLGGGNKIGNSTALPSMRASSSKTGSSLGRLKNPGRGLAKAQLGRAAQLSGAASRSSVPETMSQNASNAFHPPISGSDQAISGSGAGTGGAGTGASSGPTQSGGGGGGGGGQGNPSLGGGGAGTNTQDICDSIFPDGGFVNGSGGGCVCPPGQDSQGGNKCSSVHSDNATPWQGMVDMAKILIILATILLAAAALMALLADAQEAIFGTGTLTWRQLSIWLAGIAAVLAGIATLIGISILMQGGQAEAQGTILTICGGLLTASAAVVAFTGYNAADMAHLAVLSGGAQTVILVSALVGAGAGIAGAAAS